MTDPALPQSAHPSTRCFRLLLVSLLLGAVTFALSLELLWRRPYVNTLTVAPLLLSSPNRHSSALQQPRTSQATIPQLASGVSSAELGDEGGASSSAPPLSAAAALSESSLVLLTFVSACKNGVNTLLPILKSIERWAAHTRRTLPEATLVVALPRLGWQAYVDSLPPDVQSTCSVQPILTFSPTNVSFTLPAGVTLHTFSASPTACPLGVDLLLFLDDMPRAALTAEERLSDARHSWFPDGCYQLWRDRILAIQLMQQLSTQHRVVVSLDPDAYICPGPGKARLMEHLQSLAGGESDSVSTMAPIPLGNGKVPYLPNTALERNCGVLGFASHNSSRLLTQAWYDSLHKQVVCADCDLHGDQTAYREAVYTHYDQQQRRLREHIVADTDFCRWKGTCSTGCLIVHRHDNERGYTGNSSMPDGPHW